MELASSPCQQNGYWQQMGVLELRDPVKKYKAQLVAKSFHQSHRFDYTETFHQWLNV